MTEDEKDLLIGCFKADRHAQGEFVTRFSNLVYNAVLNTLKARGKNWQTQDVEDLHQTVFVRLLEKNCRRLRQFQGKNGCSLRSWVHMISVRTVIDHLRSRSDALNRSGRVDSEDFLQKLGTDRFDPLTALEHAQQMDTVQRGLQALLPRDRLLIKLHCFQELPIEEVAGILSISVNNAYSLKHRALHRLKTAVKGYTGKSP